MLEEHQNVITCNGVDCGEEPWFFFSVCVCSSASVSMFFRNDSTVPPYPLQLPGCALDCPLEDFVRITKLSISDDRDKECKLPTENRSNVSADNSTAIWLMCQKTADLNVNKCNFFSFPEVIISLVLSGCLLFLLIIILLGVICCQKEPVSSQRYQKVINEEVGENSWHKYRLLSRGSASLTSWESSDDTEL